jgi:hypothetical protein
VEVWNGPWRECNREALDWWQAQLVAGRRLAAVGGSDAHRPNHMARHGNPTSWVWSRSRSVEAILEAILQGHVFLSYSPEGPTVDLRCGGYMMGDEIEAPLSGELEVAVRGQGSGDTVRIISDEGIEQEIPVADADESEALTLRLPLKDRRFYRVEVWRYFAESDKTLMAAMTNPIYFRAQRG